MSVLFELPDYQYEKERVKRYLVLFAVDFLLRIFMKHIKNKYEFRIRLTKIQLLTLRNIKH